MTHGSVTQSICPDEECKECEEHAEPAEPQDNKASAPPQPSSAPKGREEDDYLMDIHPYENIYVTNPKTGRKIK